MKQLSLILALLTVVMSVMLVMTACSGSASDATEATEAVTDATEAATVIQTQSETSEEDIAKKYVPLTVENVGLYLAELYQLDFTAISDLKALNGENDSVIFTFVKDGQHYTYTIDCETGKILEKDEGNDETPDAATERETTINDVAEEACFMLLDGFDHKHRKYPDDIRVRQIDNIIHISCTWDGEKYKFEYNIDTGEPTQVMP